MDWTGSGEGQWAWFPAADALEFVNATLGFDTRRAGLHCDDFRKTLPDAARYRPWVLAAFAGVSAVGSGGYTPAAAAVRSGLRTGQALLLNFTVPCPAVTPRVDCHAIWQDWGECEADGAKVVRYTVEADAAGGGRPCTHSDGYEERRTCTP